MILYNDEIKIYSDIFGKERSRILTNNNRNIIGSISMAQIYDGKIGEYKYHIHNKSLCYSFGYHFNSAALSKKINGLNPVIAWFTNNRRQLRKNSSNILCKEELNNYRNELIKDILE
jgi:hypothetical protein